MKRFIAFITFLLSNITTTNLVLAEQATYSFSPTFGLYDFDPHQELKSSALVGLRITQYLDPSWALEGFAAYVPTESKTIPGNNDEISGLVFNLDGLYHFNSHKKWQPFLAAGLGVLRLDGDRTGADTNLMFNYGGGVKYHHSKQTAIRIDARHILVDDTHTEHNVVYTIGLEFSWGRTKKIQSKATQKSSPAPILAQKQTRVEAPARESAGAAAMVDSDKDGVPDSHDLCPQTPLGVTVDSEGCAIDSDNDGVPNYLDQCPKTPAGLMTDKNGCTLDSDDDGVPDSRDYCTHTPIGVNVDGKGCPLEKDSDGDGVSDAHDKCPNTPAGTLVDKHGCPEVIVEKTTTESHLRFETGKAIIRPQFMGEVERIANYLKKFSEIEIEIEGHTDTTGPEQLNIRLSLARAESLKSALVGKFGIEAGRLKTQGYSWNRPIADNETEEGRRKNRRVVVTLTPPGK